jgi:hypothetical protein
MLLGLEQLKRPKQHLMDTISNVIQDTAMGKREDIMMPM